MEVESMDISKDQQTKEVSEAAILKINAKDRAFNAELFGQTIRTGFSKLYNDPLLSDITLLLGQEKIPAHRMVLCAWSETFRSMLSQEWKESQLQELPIMVEEEDRLHFKNMLKYMYTGDVSFVTGENVISLIRLSDYYGILSLKEVCGELLGEQVSEDNLFYLLDIVEHFDCQRLNACCGAFLAEHFGDMLEETPERLMSLKISTWAEMLKSDDLQIRSEEKLYEAVMAYANQFKEDAKKRDEAITTLLPRIRFPFLRATYLVKKIETDTSITHLPIVHQCLHQTYRFKMYPKSQTIFQTAARKGFQRFDSERSSGSIRLSDDQLKASLTSSSGWQNVRCVCPFSATSNYCEFKVEQGPNVMLGVVHGDCSRTGYAGQYANGWTYYSQGGMYHAGGTPQTGERYNVGDRVGVRVDLEEGKVIFYKNGKVTLTVTGLPKKDKELFYPIACFSAMGDSVSLVEKTSKKGKYEDTKGSTDSSVANDDDGVGGLFDDY